jgi:hypothetical protein
MSRQNKVNPDHYKVAGRLSMDDLARERRNQSASQMGDLRGRHAKAMPPWMTKEGSPSLDAPPRDDHTQATQRTRVPAAPKSSVSQRAPAAKSKPVTTPAREGKPRGSTTPRTRSIAAKAKTPRTTSRKSTKTPARKTASKRTARSRAR